jgi:hypothetical protein
MNRKLSLLAAVAAATLLPAAANAATTIYQQGVFGAPAGYNLYSDFDTPLAQSVVTGTNIAFPTGTVSGQYVQVPGNNTPYLVVFGGGSATITFNQIVKSFSFDYSTVDTYNNLLITYDDATTDPVSGTDILNAYLLPSGSTSGSFIVNGNGKTISSITLTTTSNSFEVDNLAISANLAAVPEPATWAMMLTGFGLVGLSARRRQRVITQTA